MAGVCSALARVCVSVRWHLADCERRFISHRENKLKYDTSLSCLSSPAFHCVERRRKPLNIVLRVEGETSPPRSTFITLRGSKVDGDVARAKA